MKGGGIEWVGSECTPKEKDEMTINCCSKDGSGSEGCSNEPTLLQAYKTMSNQKTVPKGLCKHEVEQGHTKKPPISYIPVEDKIGDKVKSDPCTFKVKVDDKTTVNAGVWTGGNPEGFVIHVISAMNYIERSKLFEEWLSAKNTKDQYFKDLQDVQNYLDQHLENKKKALASTTTAKKK